MAFAPLFELNYIEQKTGDIIPTILFSGFTYKRCKYHIEIQASIKEAFDNEKRTDYPDELISLLESYGFTRSEVDNSYELVSSSENTIYKKLVDLTNELSELK